MKTVLTLWIPWKGLGGSGVPGDTLRTADLNYLKWNPFLGNLQLKAQTTLGVGEERREKDSGNIAKTVSVSVITHFFFLNKDNTNTSFLVLKGIYYKYNINIICLNI